MSGRLLWNAIVRLAIHGAIQEQRSITGSLLSRVIFFIREKRCEMVRKISSGGLRGAIVLSHGIFGVLTKTSLGHWSLVAETVECFLGKVVMGAAFERPPHLYTPKLPSNLVLLAMPFVGC